MKYSNEWLLAEMKRCRDAGGTVSPELGQAFVYICTRRVRQPGYKSLSYQDDMIAHAVLQLCNSWIKFDPTKSDNPFAYLTQCAAGACCVYVCRERKQQQYEEAPQGRISD